MGRVGEEEGSGEGNSGVREDLGQQRQADLRVKVPLSTLLSLTFFSVTATASLLLSSLLPVWPSSKPGVEREAEDERGLFMSEGGGDCCLQ